MGKGGDQLLSNSASGATVLMLGQVFSKLSTFTLNQLVIRFVSPTALGVSSYIEFIISTILFFSREGIRLACQRLRESADKDTVQSIVNLSFIPVVLGTPVALVALYTQLLYHVDTAISSMPNLKLQCAIILASVMLELLAEPFYNVNQFQLDLKKRAKIESFAASLRCVVQFSSASLFYKNSVTDVSDDQLVLSYCLGQFAYSAGFFCIYYASSRGIPFALRRVPSGYFNASILAYWKSIFFQLILKHMLTEGDRFLINKMCSTEEQGLFALINNYGSLLARMLFAPIEESIRMFLTKMSSSSKLTRDQRASLVQFLGLLFKFYVYLCCVICIFAPSNTQYLMEKVIGRGWSKSQESAHLLFSAFKMYWFYIPLLCVNGIMEAIFYSVSFEPRQVSRYSKIMGISSLLFVGATTFFIHYLKLSLYGLILANMLNMVPRIIYCWRYANSLFDAQEPNLWSTVATKKYAVLCAYAIPIWLLQIQVLGDTTSLGNLVQSASLGVLFVLLSAFMERDLILSTATKVFKKKQQ